MAKGNRKMVDIDFAASMLFALLFSLLGADLHPRRPEWFAGSGFSGSGARNRQGHLSPTTVIHYAI